jgi:presenilin-like A22 family membrane protease
VAGISGSIAVGLSPNALVILLTLLAFYDIVAVYATKHMVRMFRGLVSRGVMLAFVLTRLKREDLLAPPERPSAAMLLGTGDVALPAMLVASSLRLGTAPAVGTALGALLGFVLMFALFLGQERRRPMPALPPIALGAVLGHFIGLLL